MPGAVEPMLPEALSNRGLQPAPGRGPPGGDGRDGAATAPTCALGRFHRSLIRSDARLTYEEVDEVFAGEERARRSPGPSRWPPRDARRAPARARASSAARSRWTSASRSSSSTTSGHVVGVRARGADGVAPHDRAADGRSPTSRWPGYLEDRGAPTLYRVHERPDPQSVEFLVDAARVAGGAHAAGAEADDAAAGGRARRRDQPHGRRARAPHRPRPRRLSPRSCCARSSRPSTRPRTSATPAWPARATATSPRRSAATRTSWSTARCSAALGLDDAAPRADELDEAGVESSAAERDAMEIERDADDVCRCFLLERQLAEAGRERRLRGRGRRA